MSDACRAAFDVTTSAARAHQTLALQGSPSSNGWLEPLPTPALAVALRGPVSCPRSNQATPSMRRTTASSDMRLWEGHGGHKSVLQEAVPGIVGMSASAYEPPKALPSCEHGRLWLSV